MPGSAKLGCSQTRGFTSRLEENLHQIEYDHRFIARVWPLWLKRAWPQVEIWAGWSEVRLPEYKYDPRWISLGKNSRL